MNYGGINGETMKSIILFILLLFGLLQILFGQSPDLIAQNGHGPNPIFGLAFSPNGELIASASWGDGSVRLWEVEDGLELRSFQDPEVLFNAVSFNSNGNLLAAVSQLKNAKSGFITVWDLKRGDEVKKIKIQANPTNVAFSPNNQIIAISNWEADKKHSIELWNIETGKQLKILEGHTDLIKTLLFSDDGNFLFSGSLDKTLKIWNINTGEFEVRDFFPGIFSNDGKLAIRNDDKIKILDVKNQKEIKEVTTITVPRPGELSNFIYSAVFSPDGKLLVSGEALGLIRLWNSETGKQVKTFERKSFFFSRLSVAADGKTIAFGDLQGNIKIWDLDKGELLKPIKESTVAFKMGFTHNGKYLATTNLGFNLKLWDLLTNNVFIIPAVSKQFLGKRELDPIGNLTAMTQKDAGGATSFSFNKTGSLIIIGGKDKIIRLWNVENRKFVKEFLLGEEPVSVSISNDNKTLIGAGEKSIKIWQIADGKLISKILRNCPTEIKFNCNNQIALSSDNKSIIGFVDADTLNIWNLNTGKLIKSFGKKDESAKYEIIKQYSKLGGDIITDKFFIRFTQDSNKLTLFENGTGRELATLSIYDNGWLLSTPNGYFDGTPNAWKNLIWRFNNNTFDYGAVELYFNDFFYPNLLQDVLAGKSPQAKTGSELEKIDRRQPLVEIVSINGQSKEQLGGQTVFQTRTAKVVVEVTENLSEKKQPNHQRTSGAQDLRLMRNGSLVRHWKGNVFEAASGCEKVKTLPDEAGSVRCAVEVPIIAGENNFTAYAFNLQNVKSEDDAVLVKGADALKRDGTLYVLAVGVNKYQNADYDLRYAVPDIVDISAKIKQEQAKLPDKQYAKTEIITLKDATATKDNILTALKLFAENSALPADVCARLDEKLCNELKSELGKIKLAQPEDALLIYYAGHGTSKEQRFYLLPHNFTDAEKLEKQAVSDLELNQYLEKVDAGKLLMVIDACQSGQALGGREEGRAPMNSKGLAQLAYDKGMLILTAAQSYQAALEAPRIGDKRIEHGLLTFALLEAFSNKEADKDANRQIWEREWFDFAVSQVPLLQREAMKQRDIDLKNKTADVQGRSGIYYVNGDKNQNAEERSVQTPRVFYRREPEIKPFILANP